MAVSGSVWQSVKPAFADAAATHFLPSRACVVALVQTATHFNTLEHAAANYALQHTATRCNTLQRTGTHCNTLQYTATHHNILQHTAFVVSRRSPSHPLQHTANTSSPIATHRNTLPPRSHGGLPHTFCNSLQHTAIHRHTPQHTTTHCLRDLAAVSPPPSATHCNTLQHTATHRNTLPPRSHGGCSRILFHCLLCVCAHMHGHVQQSAVLTCVLTSIRLRVCVCCICGCGGRGRGAWRDRRTWD